MSYLDAIIPKVTVPEGESGPWSIIRTGVPNNPVWAFRERHFQPGTYTQLRCRGRGLIMSDTPAERYDHLPFVRAAKGRVLISGLGLGMCVGAVLRKPEVEEVTVLEISDDVIGLVGDHYADSRLTIIHADAMEWRPPRGAEYDAVWHDIWDAICADNLPQIATLNRRYARKTQWRGCWSQSQLRRQRRFG